MGDTLLVSYTRLVGSGLLASWLNAMVPWRWERRSYRRIEIWGRSAPIAGIVPLHPLHSILGVVRDSEEEGTMTLRIRALLDGVNRK
jgi:hypothetical protein